MPESKQIEQCKPGIPQTTPTTAPPFLLDIIIPTSLPFSALSESKSWTFEMRNKQVPERVPFFGFLFCCFVIAFRNNLQSDPKAGPKNDQTWTLFGLFSNDFWLSLRGPNCFLMTFGSHFEAQIGPKWFQDGPKMALEESWNGGTWRAYEKLAIILCFWRRKKGVG